MSELTINTDTTNPAPEVEGQLELDGMPEQPERVQLAEVNLEDLLGEQTEWTAYQIHTILNKIFEQVGVPTIRPQMIYNYARNGMLVKGESVAKNTYEARKYNKDEVVGFVARFATKHVQKHS